MLENLDWKSIYLKPWWRPQDNSYINDYPTWFSGRKNCIFPLYIRLHWLSVLCSNYAHVGFIPCWAPWMKKKHWHCHCGLYFAYFPNESQLWGCMPNILIEHVQEVPVTDFGLWTRSNSWSLLPWLKVINPLAQLPHQRKEPNIVEKDKKGNMQSEGEINNAEHNSSRLRPYLRQVFEIPDKFNRGETSKKSLYLLWKLLSVLDWGYLMAHFFLCYSTLFFIKSGYWKKQSNLRVC